MCTRIWWVRPVCSVARTRQARRRVVQQLERGHGRLAGMLGQVHHRHAQPLARVAADRRVDDAARPAPASGRAPIARYWRATSRAAIIAPAPSMAARVRATTISPLVSLSRRWTIPARGSSPRLRIARQQAVEQRAAPVARRRVHHQPRRLVDHQQVLVLVHHRQRHRLGAEGLALRRGPQLDASASPALTRWAGRLARRPLTATAPPFDQLLQVAARELGHQLRQRLVQAHAVPGCVERELAPFRGRFGGLGLVVGSDGTSAAAGPASIIIRPCFKKVCASCFERNYRLPPPSRCCCWRRAPRSKRTRPRTGVRTGSIPKPGTN